MPLLVLSAFGCRAYLFYAAHRRNYWLYHCPNLAPAAGLSRQLDHCGWARRSVGQKVSTAVGQPGSHSFSLSVRQSVTQAVWFSVKSQLRSRPANQPGSHSSRPAACQPVSQPVGHYVFRSGRPSVSHSVSQSLSQPVRYPVSQSPESLAFSQSVSRPAIHADIRLASQSGSQPSAQ